MSSRTKKKGRFWIVLIVQLLLVVGFIQLTILFVGHEVFHAIHFNDRFVDETTYPAPDIGKDMATSSGSKTDYQAYSISETALIKGTAKLSQAIKPSFPKICLLTPEIEGALTNGGMGTAMSGQAISMAKLGYQVLLVSTIGQDVVSDTLDDWVQHYKSKGVTLTSSFSERPTHYRYTTSDLLESYEAFSWLESNHESCDIVHFGDYMGCGFVSLQMKKLGLAFRNQYFIVQAHGQSSWANIMNHKMWPTDFNSMMRQHLETLSLANADAVISPSQYMLGWLEESGLKLPTVRRVLFNIELNDTVPDRAMKSYGRKKVEEIVFFGQLCRQKGALIFLHSIIDLVRWGQFPSGIKVSFVGKNGEWDGEVEYYMNVLQSHVGQYNRIVAETFGDAMWYLDRPGVVVVTPSFDENFPTTLVECQVSLIPIIASRVGGVPEMIPPQFLKDITFLPTVESLRSKLIDVMKDGVVLAPSLYDAEKAISEFHRYHLEIKRDRAISKSDPQPLYPYISVIVVDTAAVLSMSDDRNKYVNEIAKSLSLQTYPQDSFEVILVRDKTDNLKLIDVSADVRELFLKRNWRIIEADIHRETLVDTIAAGRNVGSSVAKGPYVLFMRDDHISLPQQLLVMSKAIQSSGSDIISASLDFCHASECIWDYDKWTEHGTKTPGNHIPFHGRMIFAGTSAGGPCGNRIGDTSILMKKQTFEKVGQYYETISAMEEQQSSSGRTGDEEGSTITGCTDMACLDWEFLLRALFHGLVIDAVPTPLFMRRFYEGTKEDYVYSNTNKNLEIPRLLRRSNIVPSTFIDAMMMGCSQKDMYEY